MLNTEHIHRFIPARGHSEQAYTVLLLHGTAVLLTAGENDPIVPAANTSTLADLFNQAGAQVELFWHQSGHTLIEEEINRANLFLKNL